MVRIKVRALHIYRVVFITWRSANFTDLHGNSLLLSTAESLWGSRSRQFTERAINFTVWIIMLNTNNIMHGIRARQIGIPAFRQTLDYGVSTSETSRLLDKLEIGGMFGITEGDVVLNLGGNSFRDINEQSRSNGALIEGTMCSPERERRSNGVNPLVSLHGYRDH